MVGENVQADYAPLAANFLLRTAGPAVKLSLFLSLGFFHQNFKLTHVQGPVII
jgi:hypothetical protein